MISKVDEQWTTHYIWIQFHLSPSKIIVVSDRFAYLTENSYDLYSKMIYNTEIYEQHAFIIGCNIAMKSFDEQYSYKGERALSHIALCLKEKYNELTVVQNKNKMAEA